MIFVLLPIMLLQELAELLFSQDQSLVGHLFHIKWFAMNVPHQFLQICCFQLGLYKLVDYVCHCTGKLNDYNLRLEKHGHYKEKDSPHEQLLTALGLIKWNP